MAAMCGGSIDVSRTPGLRTLPAGISLYAGVFILPLPVISAAWGVNILQGEEAKK